MTLLCSRLVNVIVDVIVIVNGCVGVWPMFVYTKRACICIQL